MSPLLSRDFLIPFDEINAEHIETGIKAALERAKTDLDKLITNPEVPSYGNTLQALDDLTERLSRAMTLAFHLTSVETSPEIRTAFNTVLPTYSAFFASLPLNEDLWRRLSSFAETDEAQSLEGVFKRHLDKTLQDFVRAGANLPPDKKARVEEVKVELSQLQTKFSENVLDATNAFDLVITDKKDLSGLPESVINQAKADAQAKGVEGYRFTLQIPSYLPFMKHAQARELRQQLYEAFVNRASSGEHDNRPLIDQILTLRQELAQLLGYKDFADYRLEVNMVKTGSAALAFEEDIFAKTLGHWKLEVATLERFAADSLGLSDLAPWDLSFAIEQLRKAEFDLDDEVLRPYFSLNNVLAGLFEMTKRLFGVSVSERENSKVWHADVGFYDLHDDAGTHLGSFYTDWFPRETKRDGAWKNGFIIGGPATEGFVPHLAVIVANFTPPQDGKPALLTHREVQTIFHEFGHLLHHCLSQVEVAELGATNVARDWVELPSQILENWTWEREALDLFARHFETGERIPEALYQKMLAARTFMEANAQMRQLSFGTVDLKLHIDYEPNEDGDVIAYSQRIMERYTLRPEFAHNNFIAAFGHVFSGGYAAGYYSYKWSEVLDADAFTRFKREGIFNRKTGQAFVDTVLSRGDSAEPADLYREFMGRDPDLNALIERNLGSLKHVTTGD